ncbi:hypothetical protein PQX77_013421 [Marasmius sp. AFHP31]|nr:hypothetical protein PQX77_013421 [Marasmius sp. AFHP31]
MHFSIPQLVALSLLATTSVQALSIEGRFPEPDLERDEQGLRKPPSHYPKPPHPPTKSPHHHSTYGSNEYFGGRFTQLCAEKYREWGLERVDTMILNQTKFYAQPDYTVEPEYSIAGTGEADLLVRKQTFAGGNVDPKWRDSTRSLFSSPLQERSPFIKPVGMDFGRIMPKPSTRRLDDLQRGAEDAGSKGKRFLTMDHPCHLMSSSFINSHIDVPRHTTWPTPVVMDHKLDVPTNASTTFEATAEDRELDLKLYSNPTLIPNRFFFSFTPIVTIRHPAHAAPSAYRVFLKSDVGVDLSHPELPVLTSYKWARLVFDCFKFYGGMEKDVGGRAADAALSIVVDGEKLVKGPQGQMKKVCDILGLDEGGIRYNWDNPEMWKGSKFGATFFKTLNESSGVVLDPKYNKPLHIETEEEKWVEEWDEETARVLRKMVQEAMEDYRYLLQYSLGHPAFQSTRPITSLAAHQVGIDAQASLSPEAIRDGCGLDDDTVSKASWQNFLDNLQKSALDAESKGKRFLTMDHPFQLLSSAFVNSHIDVPGRTTWPTPVVVDYKLDVPMNSSTLGAAEDRELDLKLCSNPTLIPDRFFFSFRPVITIRHPAHAIPSAHRAYLKSDMGVDISHPDFPVVTSYKWARLAFDSFKSYGGMEKDRGEAADVTIVPIVVDGEKLVKNPKGQMKKVCDMLGLDEGEIRYNWDKPEIGKARTKVGDAFLKTLNESNGVVLDPKYNKPLDIETEEEKWVEEWDEETARILRKMVQEAMEDYRYLLQYSV